MNPGWWHDNLNQFGLLKVWQVDKAGTSVDGVRISSVTIDEIGIGPWQTTRVRVGVKPEALNQGGFTPFGKGFGNYEHDLVLRLHYVFPGQPGESASSKKRKRDGNAVSLDSKGNPR